jgi:hypothetical protein
MGSSNKQIRLVLMPSPRHPMAGKFSLCLVLISLLHGDDGFVFVKREVSLSFKRTFSPATLCRVTRQATSTIDPAETKPDSTLLAQVLDFQKIMQAFRKNGMLKHV